jgi:hypothetical protein
MMRTLLDDIEKEAKEANTPTSLSEFERKRGNFYRDQSRAGQVVPGETKSAVRLSKGALGRPERPARRHHPNGPENPKPSRYTFGALYGQPPT